MKIDSGSERPIFIQIAEQIEDSIFTGFFPRRKRSLPPTRWLFC